MPITKLFTDGSTLNNQGAKKGCSYGGYGGYVLFSDGNEQVFSEPLEGDKITNQVAELMALKHGLEIVLPIIAKTKDLKLSEYGLTKKDGTKIPINSEYDVFKILEMHYLKPNER